MLLRLAVFLLLSGWRRRRCRGSPLRFTFLLLLSHVLFHSLYVRLAVAVFIRTGLHNRLLQLLFLFDPHRLLHDFHLFLLLLRLGLLLALLFAQRPILLALGSTPFKSSDLSWGSLLLASCISGIRLFVWLGFGFLLFNFAISRVKVSKSSSLGSLIYRVFRKYNYDY